MNAIVLDTHVWIWLILGEELAPKQVQGIEKAARQGALFISSISLWEASMLIAKSRLCLNLSPSEWFRQALSLPGLSQIPLNAEIVLDSSFLPEGFHGDPADRLIVASTRYLQAELWTRDQKILAYAQKGHLKAKKI